MHEREAAFLHLMDINLANSDLVAVIDPADVALVEPLTWRVQQIGHLLYATTGRSQLMHRVIFGDAAQGFEVDHINGNGLDNRRENLRLVTHAEQMQNRKVHKNSKTGFRGVCWDPAKQKYRGSVKRNGKRLFSIYSTDLAAVAEATKAARAELMSHVVER